MGGVYTLGVQPGTLLRGNHIHDVEKANYGGWAIYLDEGSSHIVVEDNVCYDTTSQPFNCPVLGPPGFALSWRQSGAADHERALSGRGLRRGGGDHAPRARARARSGARAGSTA